MSMSFQFSFLGKEHNYVASVRQVGKAGIPVDFVSVPANTAFYGIPQSFRSFYERLGSFSYMYNVRGHDFLSHMGQWKNQNESGTLMANRKIFGEISELQKFAEWDQNVHGGEPNLIVSFGPDAGSFFAEAWRPKLKDYRWENLPPALNSKLQNLRGCGKRIWDVALNGSKGWVLQLDGGKQWVYGGPLPRDLERALSEMSRKNMAAWIWKKVSITRLIMNHQHPSEYVLLFSDGTVHARLHRNFEGKLKTLLQKWADESKKPLGWNFEKSCDCSETSQQKADASYYSQRGVFHMKRGDFELAYCYLREAYFQNPKDRGIRSRYVKALSEFRAFLKDPELEQHLAKHSQWNGLPLPFSADDSLTIVARFRQDYILMMTTTLGLTEGELNLDMAQQKEWSYLSYETAEDIRLHEAATNSMNPWNRWSELPESAMQLAGQRHFSV